MRPVARSPFLVLVCGIALASLGTAHNAPSLRQVAPRLSAPLFFHPRETVDGSREFHAEARGISLDIGPDGAGLRLRCAGKGGTRVSDSATTGATVKVRCVGGRVGVHPEPERPLPARVNYLLGRDPHRWKAGVGTCARIRSRDVYPGIDQLYYGGQSGLEYDFVVRPGADPDRIRLRFEGAGKVSVDPSGDLVLSTPGGEIVERRPQIYQESDGVRIPISGGYRLAPRSGEVTFQLGTYDSSKEVVIDPVLAYSTFIGGSAEEDAGGGGVAVDAAGNIYVTGGTKSTDFPVHSAAQATSGGGGSDAYVAKFDPSGQPVYLTYLGGSGFDAALDVAPDAGGSACVVGYTSSANFPLSHAAQATLNGDSDAFVARLSPDGSSLQFSTYLGGSADEVVSTDDGGIAVDASGNIYAAGSTFSANFRTTALAFQHNFGGGQDAFVTAFHPNGTVIYSTYLGGSGSEFQIGIAAKADGTVSVVGTTSSADFPTKDAAQAAFGGGVDAFVTMLAPDGKSTVFSTYLGGTGADAGSKAAVDPAGNTVITGYSFSTDFPTHNAIQSTRPGTIGTIAARLSPTGTVIYATYLGGGKTQSGYGVATDDLGNGYFAGGTDSTDFPVPNSGGSAHSGGEDAYLAVLGPSGSQLYGTYLGGSNTDSVRKMAADRKGSVYLTGYTASSNFPTAGTPYQSTLGGVQDAFLAQIRFEAPLPVSNLQASPQLGEVDLSWSDLYSAPGYHIWRGQGNTAPAVIATTNDRSYADHTAAPGVPYTYRVTALSLGGDSSGVEASATIPVGGKMKLSPAKIKFPTVKAGMSKSKSLKIQNAGTTTLAVAVGTPAGPFRVAAGGGSFSLSPRASRTVTVQLGPGSTGSYTGSLPVASSDPAHSNVTVPLSGKIQ